MTRNIVLCAAGAVCLTLASGCLGRFAANQGRRQAARSADYYARTYVEPELDPERSGQFRETRDDMADVIVRSGNERQKRPVGVNDRGYIVNR